jgi:hypothetical protein
MRLSHVSSYGAGNTVRYRWRIRDQLDVISYYVLYHFFYAQHVSDINTSIIRSLRLFYCITTLVVSMSVGVSVWLGCINVRNMLSIEEVK